MSELPKDDECEDEVVGVSCRTCTFRLVNNVLVPVVWDHGPVYCAYCPNHQSKSFVALYRHLGKYHKEEIKIHRSFYQGPGPDRVPEGVVVTMQLSDDGQFAMDPACVMELRKLSSSTEANRPLEKRPLKRCLT